MINLKYFKNDFFGGLTAAIVALPLALAFGVSSGMGALAGMYGAIFVGFFASLFGGTPKQISGPTGPMTVIVALIFIEFNFKAEIVFFCISLAGIIQIFIGILKIGNYVKKIPSSVISGFMTGIGIIIITLQIPVFFGLGSESSVINSILSLKNILNLNSQSFFIGTISLIGLFLLPSKFLKIIPNSIIVLLIGTIFSILFFNQQDVIGNIPNGIPKISFYLPDAVYLPKILFYSLLLAMLGTIDSLLTSIIADKLTNDNHKPNKEMIGQGLGNFLAGMLGGIAGAGATMRTVVNINSGGKSKLSGIIHSIILLLIVLFFSPIAEIIPLSILSAILIKVGIDIIDWDFIKNYNLKSTSDLLTKIIVVFFTVFTNLILAVFIGVLFNFLIKIFNKNKN